MTGLTSNTIYYIQYKIQCLPVADPSLASTATVILIEIWPLRTSAGLRSSSSLTTYNDRSKVTVGAIKKYNGC